MSSMDYRTLSPTSSFTSELPSEDISDFSDSEFDIVSSSGSTRSHEREGAVSVNNIEESEEEFQTATLEPASLLDTDWLGVTTSTITPNHGVVRLQGAAVAKPVESNATTITDDDAIVMDALSRSLERSTESVHTSTPINGSLHNLHFVTSPKPARRPSTAPARAQSAASTPMSGSGIQLEFPDPLSTSDESIGHIFTTVTQSPIPEACVQTELPKQIQDSPSLEMATLVEGIPRSTAEPNNATVPVIVEARVPTTPATIGEPASKAFDEKLEPSSPHFIRARASAFTEGRHVALVPKVILNAANILGHRWAASVIVSIFALLIGATTYIGAPTTVPTRLPPSTTTPTSSLWSVAYPSNKSSPTSASLSLKNAVSIVKDISLSSVTSSTRLAMENTAQGRKRKLGSLACESTRKEKPIKTLDSSAAKLLIDGPSFWSKGKWPMKEVEPIPEPSSSTYKPCKSSPNALLTLRDAKSIRETIVDYLSPSSTAYSGLAEDVSSLMRALDDLLVSINAQTAKVVFRTREEALYRHGRAKSNAKKLKKQGKEFLRSFKKTVAVQAKAGRINAKEVKSLVKDVTEGVKEGIGQTLKIKRRETGYGRKEHGCGENGRSKGGTRAQRRAEKAEKRKFCREYGR